MGLLFLHRDVIHYVEMQADLYQRPNRWGCSISLVSKVPDLSRLVTVTKKRNQDSSLGSLRLHAHNS